MRRSDSWKQLVKYFILMSVVFGTCGSAFGFRLETGNDDVELSWNNTFRYTYGYRATDQNSSYLKNVNVDDGERNFDVGTVMNRMDVISELDMSYQRTYGLRVSGAFWYDQAYDNSLDNDSPFTSNHLDSNGQPATGLDNYADRFFTGPSGELLDALVFGKNEIMGTPVSYKIGRHTLYWGESLLTPGAINGISYAQMPIDFSKALSQPGAEVKELFRPLNNVSARVDVSPTLSLAGQYFLEWEEMRFPEAGTYLSPSDVIQRAGESVIVGFDPNAGQFVRFTKMHAVEPDSTGDWGVSARWSPELLNGSLGLYYREFSDKIPQVGLLPLIGQYALSYASDIKLYGVSLVKEVAGVSVGTELSYREDMPLNSDAAIALSVPDRGETFGARGNTWHGVLNVMGLLGDTPIFDGATYIVELAWSHLDKVTQGEDVYQGRDSYSGVNKCDKNSFAAQINFTPVWYQVFSGVDISAPLAFNIGLSGNSPVNSGGNEDAGTYSVGIGADFFQNYKADLTYVGFFGDYDTDSTGAMTVSNGTYAQLRDRNTIYLTLKTTF